MVKVAVSSSDGVLINEHFGSTKEFFIYEVFEDGTWRMIERRSQTENGESGADHARAALAAELLADVEAVLTAQIGRNAEYILQRRGIKAYSITGRIDHALQTYGIRSSLIRNLAKAAPDWRTTGGGCGTSAGGCSGCGPKTGTGCAGNETH